LEDLEYGVFVEEVDDTLRAWAKTAFDLVCDIVIVLSDVLADVDDQVVGQLFLDPVFEDSDRITDVFNVHSIFHEDDKAFFDTVFQELGVYFVMHFTQVAQLLPRSLSHGMLRHPQLINGKHQITILSPTLLEKLLLFRVFFR